MLLLLFLAQQAQAGTKAEADQAKEAADLEAAAAVSADEDADCESQQYVSIRSDVQSLVTERWNWLSQEEQDQFDEWYNDAEAKLTAGNTYYGVGVTRGNSANGYYNGGEQYYSDAIQFEIDLDFTSASTAWGNATTQYGNAETYYDLAEGYFNLAYGKYQQGSILMDGCLQLLENATDPNGMP